MFEGWTLLESILGGSGAVLVAAAIVFTVKCSRNLVKTIKETAVDVKEMKDGGVKRKEETRMLFKGILTVFDIMKGKEMNGSIKELQEAYNKHFIDNVN